MLVNVVALIVLLALIAIGIAVIVRALLAPVPGMTPCCARCGRDARELSDFTCPGCGYDVREAGLVAAPADSAAARFWRAAAITALVIGAWGFTNQFLAHAAPS